MISLQSAFFCCYLFILIFLFFGKTLTCSNTGVFAVKRFIYIFYSVSQFENRIFSDCYLDQTLVFMDHGVSLDSIENAIGSLLRLAISERCVENEEIMERNIKYLLSNGAKLHNTQPFKESELIMAIKRRFFSIADIFITVGADLKHIGEKGNSVLHVICKGMCIIQ